MSLFAIQSEIIARIDAARIGTALRFALMASADAMSRAIEAEARLVHPETQKGEDR